MSRHDPVRSWVQEGPLGTGECGLRIRPEDTNINAGTWYTLTIDGNIVNGQVHYLDFIIHGTTHSLNQYSFSPTSESGSGLVAAVQVDGDSRADPYQLYVDNAHFYWSNTG
jgi:hypothetical protein